MDRRFVFPRAFFPSPHIVCLCAVRRVRAVLGISVFHASTTILPDTGVLGQIKTAGIREPPFPLAGLARFPRPVKRYKRNYNVEFDPGSG